MRQRTSTRRKASCAARTQIKPEDAGKTTILANRELSYKANAVDCSQFPWFARTFMKQHIEIENDPRVWKQIQTMIENVAESRPVMPAA